MRTYDLKTLKEKDPALYAVVEAEEIRQRDSLEMVASESVQPKEALDLAGCVFNNKTAVGVVGYQRLKGSEVANELEKLAAERACELFGADYANMTTYAGSVANFAAYGAVMNPGDNAMALYPALGAHQTHGDKRNVSSKWYNFEFFGLDPETLDLDYAGAEALVKSHRPKLIVIGSAAYPRVIDYERLAHIAHKNGTLLMADIAHFTGLVAAGQSPNPMLHADIVTGSTTKTMCGPHSGFVMCKAPLKEAVEKSIYPGQVSSLHLQTVAAMAYALKRATTEEFHTLMKNVVKNAKVLCEELKKRGFDIFTGGTDCHMFLIDLRPFGIDGVSFADELDEAGISTNSKSIPFDESPVAQGIRAGTTVLTQRGMGEREMARIADLYLDMAKNRMSAEAKARVRAEVAKLTAEFPLTF